MYARMVSLQISPEKMDEFIQAWRSAMLPAAQQQQGWKGGRLLVDRDRSKAVIEGLWATEADEAATGQGTDFSAKQQARLAGLLTAPPVVERFEIVAEA